MLSNRLNTGSVSVAASLSVSGLSHLIFPMSKSVSSSTACKYLGTFMKGKYYKVCFKNNLGRHFCLITSYLFMLWGLRRTVVLVLCSSWASLMSVCQSSIMMLFMILQRSRMTKIKWEADS